MKKKTSFAFHLDSSAQCTFHRNENDLFRLCLYGHMPKWERKNTFTHSITIIVFMRVLFELLWFSSAFICVLVFETCSHIHWVTLLRVCRTVTLIFHEQNYCLFLLYFYVILSVCSFVFPSFFRLYFNLKRCFRFSMTQLIYLQYTCSHIAFYSCVHVIVSKSVIIITR